MDGLIKQLNPEHDNLRAALQWARESGEQDIGLRLAGALWRYWRRRGYITEGRAWLVHWLTLDDIATNGILLDARIRALHGAAWLASDQHDFVSAAQYFEQSKALRRALGEAEDETSASSRLRIGVAEKGSGREAPEQKECSP